MYFEDLDQNRTLTSRKRVVTGTDIDLFATMTGAVNPLFLSKDSAVSVKMQDRMAPGILTLGLMIGALYQLGLFDNLIALVGIDKLRFLSPVYPGDVLESRAVVASKRETSKPDRGIVVLQACSVNQRNEKVIETDLTFLVKRK